MSNLDQRQSFGKISDSYMWFVPELFERQDVISGFKKKLKSSLKKDFPYFNASASDATVNVNDDDDDDDFVDQIKKLRDNPSQNIPINQVIKVDDIDTFQSIVTTNRIDIQNQKVNITLFDDFNKNISFIDYATACGFIKCFKYCF